MRRKILVSLFMSITLIFVLACDSKESIVVIFDTQGGEHVSNTILSKGDSLILVGAEKEGHIFLGWYTDQSYTYEFVSGTTVSNNLTLYAKWQIKSYSINFITNSDTDLESLVYSYDQSLENLPLLDKEGYTFLGWYLDASFLTPFDFDTMPAYDLNLYAKWDINQYTISLIFNDETEIIDFDYMAQIVISLLPEKYEHEFYGWYLNEELTTELDYLNMPAYDLTLYAKFVPNTYEILFDSNGGSAIATMSIKYESIISLSTIPYKLGAAFNGWYLDEELTIKFDYDTMPNYSFTLYASWKPLNVPKDVHTLIINYYRPDESYAGWSVWLWQSSPISSDGVNMPFTGYHEEVYARQIVIDLNDDWFNQPQLLGLVIRTSGWDKDVDQDLIIDLANYNEFGVVEVFIISQTPIVYYDYNQFINDIG